MDNLEIAKDLEIKYKGTLVLDHFKVVLFLGISIEPDDYYYVYVEEGTDKLYQSSFVGWMIPLIDRLPKDAYNYLAMVWNNNNHIPAKEIE